MATPFGRLSTLSLHKPRSLAKVQQLVVLGWKETLGSNQFTVQDVKYFFNITRLHLSKVKGLTSQAHQGKGGKTCCAG